MATTIRSPKLPSDLPSEQSVIGCLLIDPSCVETVMQRLQPSDFYHQHLRMIFEAMRELWEVKAPIDLVIVSERLRARGEYELIGGKAELLNLCNLVPTSAHLETYLDIVVRKSRRREIVTEAQALIKKASNGAADEEVLKALLSLTEENKTSLGRTVGLQTYTAQELDTKQLTPDRWVVDGYLPEGAMLLVGPPKSRKSFLALGFALAIASGGVVLGKIKVPASEVLYLDLENGEKRCKKRQRAILGEFQKAPSGLHYANHLRPMEEGGTQDLERWLDAHPQVSFVVVDTLRKTRSRNRSKNGVLYEEDYDAISIFHDIAIERGISILVVHHSKKESFSLEDWTEMISGSTGLFGAADGAMGMITKRDSKDSVLKVSHRDGEEKSEQLRFDDLTLSWISLGEADQWLKTMEQQETIEAINEHYGSKEFQPKDLCDVIENLGMDNARQRCVRLMKANILVKTNYGKYRLSDQYVGKNAVTPVTVSHSPSFEPDTAPDSVTPFPAPPQSMTRSVTHDRPLRSTPGGVTGIEPLPASVTGEKSAATAILGSKTADCDSVTGVTAKNESLYFGSPVKDRWWRHLLAQYPAEPDIESAQALGQWRTWFANHDDEEVQRHFVEQIE